MKIVAFYSYKGGQGRTLALANLGACLYRLGHKVVMLDMDLEAPGLHCKFGYSAKDDRISEAGGVLRLAEELRTQQPSHVLRNISRVAVTIAPTVEDPPNDGYLRLIPRGPFPGRRHQDNRAAIWDYFPLGMGSLFRLGSGAEVYRRNMAFLQGLPAAIAEMMPGPDYLLVDVRAGMGDLAAATMLTFADRLICFFTNDLENCEGMRHALRGIRRLTPIRKSYGIRSRRMILPVVTRLPHYLESEEYEELKRKVRKEIGWRGRICLLRSDWDLEREPRLRIHPEDQNGEKYKADDVALLREYVELLGQSFPEVLDKTMRGGKWDEIQDRAMAYLWTKAALPGKPSEVERAWKAFTIQRSLGRLVNIADEERNVALRVDTLCSVMNSAHDLMRVAQTMHDKAAVSPPRGINVRERFYENGLSTGKDFAERSLTAAYWRKARISTRNKKRMLEKWCKFDTEVGFGHLALEVYPSKGKSSSIEKGRVIVVDNFLAAGHTGRSDTNQADMCAWLAGYIAGVVGGILKRNVKVEHCKACHIDQERLCRFEFVPAERKKGGSE